MAMFGGGSVALCFLYLRTVDIRRPEAAALTLLFAVSGTQIFTAIIVETFGISGFAIALIWLIAVIRLDDPTRLRPLRYFAALLAFGVTITNVVQAFIAEMLVAWRHATLRKAVERTVVFGLIGGIVAGVLVLAVWHAELWAAAKNPIHALKEIYWMQPTEKRTAGIGRISLTFFGFSFVSPEYSWINIGNDLPVMRDFRDYVMSSIGRIAMPLWLGFWAIGAVASFSHSTLSLAGAGARRRDPLQHTCCTWIFRTAAASISTQRTCTFRSSRWALAWHCFSDARRRRAASTSPRCCCWPVSLGADNLGKAAGFAADFDKTPVSYGSGIPVAPSVQHD